MNSLIIGIVAMTVVGAVGGLYVYQSYEIPDAPERCSVVPLREASNDLDGLIRFEINNTGGSSPATLCVFADGDKVAERSITIPEGATTFDVSSPVEGVTAGIELGPGGPAPGMAGSSSKQLRLCPREAATIRIQLLEGGISVESGGCFDPDQASSVPALPTWPEQLGPAGPAAGTGIFLAAMTGLVFLQRHRVHFAFILFTRLLRPHVLDLPTRQKIHDLVSAEPGIHANAIADRLDLAQGELLYHLHVLVRQQVLNRVGSWGLRTFFVAGRYSAQEMRSMAALRMPGLERIYALVVANPGATLGDIARAAGVTRSRISRASRRLEEVGLIERRENQKQLVLFPRHRNGSSLT